MKHFLLVFLLLVQGCGSEDGCAPEAEAGHGRTRGHRRAPPRRPVAQTFPLPAGPGCDGQFSDPSYFATTSARYTSASSQWTGLGNLNTNGATAAVWFTWFRTASSSWTAGQLLAKNSSGQRAWQMALEARGGAGEIQIAIGNGTTLFSRRVPDGTFATEHYQPLCVGYNAGTLRAWGGQDLDLIALTGADTIPTSIGNSSAGVKIGANNTDAAPANFFNGHISTAAVWAGAGVVAAVASDAAFEAFCETLWNQGEVANVETLSGVQALGCVHHQTIPPTEDCASITLTGTNPTSSTEIPVDRVWSDSLFSHRVLLNIGTETFLTVPAGGHGLYPASVSMERTSTDDILITRSVGVEHVNGHVGQQLRFNEDELDTGPLSDSPYPGQSVTWEDLPHGNLSGGSKRSFTLSKAELAGFEDRIHTIFNETGYTMLSQATTVCTVILNSATCNVASTANLPVGAFIWTAGLTTNVGQGSPVAITDRVVDTSVTFPLVAANGPLADGVGTITRSAPERRIWGWYTDDDGDNWSTPVDIAGAGTLWNSVGRSKCFQLPDGSLACSYYYRNIEVAGGAIEDNYVAALLRSTDGGDTWAHYTNILISPESGGMRWEEPLCRDLRSTPLGLYVCLVRADSGADPRINGGASITERIVVRITSADGLTWSDPVLAFSGSGSHPLWFYRPSDGLIVTSAQSPNWTIASGGEVFPVLRASRDYGVTWSDDRRVDSINPPALDGLNMQGDFLLASNNDILYAWAQEWDDDQSPQVTAMWFGRIRNCALNEMATP